MYRLNSNLITYNTCFGNTLNLISFDSTLNRLTLNGGSLVYVPNRQYEIYVSTVYNNIEYYQKMIQFLNDLKSYDDNII